MTLWNDSGLSLRVTLLLLLGVGMVYVAGIAIYMGAVVGPAASRLQQGTDPYMEVFSQLSERMEELNRAMIETHRLSALGPNAELEVIERVRRRLTAGEGRVSPGPFAGIPTEMRTRLARADDETLRLENLLLEGLSLMELGRYEEARDRLLTADSVRSIVERELAEAEKFGLADLGERAKRLTTATERAVRAAVYWVVAGLLLITLLMYVARRRITVPLGDLESGLTEIAEGNLNVEIPIREEDEIGRLAQHFNEVTRVVRLRAQEQGRLAAAGELLAGVAHEVNNPLMAIGAVASTRLTDPDLDPELRLEFQQIVRQAGRAGKLVAGLLRFVRPDDRSSGPVDLNEIVRTALDLVAYQFRVDEITVELLLDPQLPPATGHPGGLEQVFVNLLSNAVDALRAADRPRRLTIESWSRGEWVEVAIADNGPGVRSEIADRLFRPFVTTKKEQGTGLGLYISREIVRECGGDLVLDREWREGARFVARLPVTEAPVAETTSPPERREQDGATSPEPRTDGRIDGLRILLVEDEQAIRRPIVRYLQRRGARVFEAADGLEALQRIGEETVDVIVADLRMPKMDGVELYTRLCEQQPDLAGSLLFLSGDVSHLDDRMETPIPRERVILKPVELARLEERLVKAAGSPIR